MKRKITKDRRRALPAGRQGFTIIEMMVAVALFAVVMLVATGALLSLVTANRKAQALQSVMNNLNTTIDSMVRAAREGTNYDCETAGTGIVPGKVHDCPNGNTQLAFEPHGYPTVPERAYALASGVICGSSSGKCIVRSDGGTTWVSVTAPEISITDMEFYVVGTAPSDTVQPKIVVVIKGIAGGTNTKITSTFHIQATAVQRVLDI